MHDQQPRTGHVLGAPYDVRKPTRERIASRMWNRQDARVIVPHAYGWGWTINLSAVARRLRLVRH
jgi:uncharacterized membrane protein